MRVIAGDIGGTKTLLRLVERATPAARARVLRENRFQSREYAGLATMVDQFLAEAEIRGVDAACFAVAGPVAWDGHAYSASLPNLTWAPLDSVQLQQQCNLGRVRLINDFEAIAHGIAPLAPDDLASVQPGQRDPRAPRVILGAGTGLGMCQIVHAGEEEIVVPSEGGHSDFAPRDEIELELWRHIAAQHGHVSWERVVSGPGLAAIFGFLAEKRGNAQQPAVRAVLDAEDVGAAVTGAARELDIAAEALEIFVRAYGAVAGNLALLSLAYGGVYLAGGIAAKILPHLQSGAFSEAFRAKGRMSDLMAGFPIDVVMNPAVGLLGAERVALNST